MVGDKTLTYPLTDEEKALVEQNHNLIWKVINDMRAPRRIRDDLYSVGALALMMAARKYLTQSKLQKHAFVAIAYETIRYTCTGSVATEVTVSLDTEINEDGATLLDIIPAPDYVPENSEGTLKAYRRVKELLSEKEYMCAELCALGLSSIQIEQYHGISSSTYNDIVWRVKRKCFAHYGEIFGTTETPDMPEKQKQRRITEEEGMEILRLFDEGTSMRQIGRIIGRRYSSVFSYIKRTRQAAT